MGTYGKLYRLDTYNEFYFALTKNERYQIHCKLYHQPITVNVYMYSTFLIVTLSILFVMSSLTAVPSAIMKFRHDL